MVQDRTEGLPGATWHSAQLPLSSTRSFAAVSAGGWLPSRKLMYLATGSQLATFIVRGAVETLPPVIGMGVSMAMGASVMAGAGEAGETAAAGEDCLHQADASSCA